MMAIFRDCRNEKEVIVSFVDVVVFHFMELILCKEVTASVS